MFVKSQPVRSNGSWLPRWIPGTPGASRSGAGHINDRGGLGGQSESAPTDNSADAPSVIELLASCFYFGR